MAWWFGTTFNLRMFTTKRIYHRTDVPFQVHTNVDIGDQLSLSYPFPHTQVWQDFYHDTINNSNGTTGYAFSRIAGGQADRPEPRFYGADQAHQHSDPRLVDPRTGQPNSQGLAELNLTSEFITSARWQPQWKPLTIANGDFSATGSARKDLLAGWSIHGGGGKGSVEKKHPYLELGLEAPSRTHNLLYIPQNTTHLRFDLRRTDQTESSNRLVVKMGDQEIKSIPLNATDDSFARQLIPISASEFGPVQTIAFEIDSAGGDIDSEVQIDNVSFFDMAATPVFEPERPILVLHGIGGSFAKVEHANEWYVNRGISPEKLENDPIAGYYNDIYDTLSNVGYVPNENLFAAPYDWRLNPGPIDHVTDGRIDGVSAASITDETYAYGVDYLGYWLDQAADAWAATHDGERPDSVDIVAHSTGGLVTRSYIQSDAYGGAYDDDGTLRALPKVNNFFMAAVPNRGASKAWRPLQNDFSADPVYRVAFSKMAARSYQRLLNGEIIRGGDYDISLDDFGQPPTEEEFIELWVPTLRALLATYDFGIDANSGLDISNPLLIDLNDGLDQLFPLGNLDASKNYTTFADGPNAISQCVC